MALTETPICEFGWPAPDFSLPATDGRTYAFADIAGPRGALVMFICNHCPYVLAVIERLVADAKVLQGEGIGIAAIMPNDWTRYPDDAPDRMAAFAQARGFSFPYLIDESQETARAYGAVCTPDFFGFDAQGGLQYRGRLDEGRTEPPPPGAARELLAAMRAVARGEGGPAEQTPSMGCSIKWRH